MKDLDKLGLANHKTSTWEGYIASQWLVVIGDVIIINKKKKKFHISPALETSIPF